MRASLVRAYLFRVLISALFPLLLLSCGHVEKFDLARLKVPPGFHIAVFADAPHARQMGLGPPEDFITGWIRPEWFIG
jgi:hypothetical protein